jgi:hypothetical protein
VVKGDLVVVGHGRQVRVVGHDRDDVDVEPSGAGPEQQVVEAVTVLADHDEDPLAPRGVGEVPGHAEGLRDRGEILPQHVGVKRPARRRLELDPHEEHADLAIVELLALDHVRVVIDEKARDGLDEAGPVGARYREHVLGPWRECSGSHDLDAPS